MSHQGVMGLDVVFGVIFSKLITIELAAIVHDKRMWDSKPCGDILVYKRLYIPLGDGGKRFRFSPFCEVVHSNDYIPALSLGWRREKS